MPGSRAWKTIREELHAGIKAVDWPAGSGKFTIYPQSGKKTGQGNGVKPIKLSLMTRLKACDWQTEGAFTSTPEVKAASARLERAIKAKESLEALGKTESGKSRAEPAQSKVLLAEARATVSEARFQQKTAKKAAREAAKSDPGRFDAILDTKKGRVALEWETGNVSSSHRALNKIVLGLLRERLVAGTLVVPTRALYRYLTDRIGNFEELAPYFKVWKNVACDNGVLEIVAIEHDATSNEIKRIPKNTDGYAKIAAAKAKAKRSSEEE